MCLIYVTHAKLQLNYDGKCVGFILIDYYVNDIEYSYKIYVLKNNLKCGMVNHLSNERRENCSEKRTVQFSDVKKELRYRIFNSFHRRELSLILPIQ